MTDSTDKPKPIIGHKLRMTRLDEQGNPTGEVVEWAGVTSVGVFGNADDEIVIDEAVLPFERITMDVTFIDIDPEVIRLYYGLKPRPWWWKLTPRWIKHKIKRRELRRGYGG